jgi:archaellum component FlaC
MSSRDKSPGAPVTQGAIEKQIREVRQTHVVLDQDLAAFYGVETKQLLQQMKRNPARFPKDFAFQLSVAETESLRSQNVTSKPGRGGRRTRPYAFTEQGALQLASVLRSSRAAQVSVTIARAFVTMRQQLHEIAELPATLAKIQNKLEELEANDADLNAQLETMAEGFHHIRQVLKALGQADRQLPQLAPRPEN